MRKTWLVAAVLGMTGLVLASGRPGVLRTKDGGVYDGTIDEQENGIVVTVRGIDTTVPRENVASITYGDFDQRWNEAYAKLDAKDDAGRMQAARRAFDERRYDLAEKAARDAQTINPGNAAAGDFLRTIQNQRRLEQAGPAAGSNGADSTPAVKPVGGWNILNGDQINRVKQWEVRDTDQRLRFSFGNNVLKKFYDATPNITRDYPTYNDFRNAPQLKQAMRIISDGTAEMAKDVKITTDPDTIVTFRRDVMPLVLQGCATSLCHGGNNAASAKFALITPASDPGSAYTNFYVLQSYSTKNTGPQQKKADGTMEGPPQVAQMVDRMRPEMSLLLQYGLPEASAQIKHPKVRGYTGIYLRGREDSKYQTIAAFISSLNPVKPEYGIDFTLTRKDAPGATTRP